MDELVLRPLPEFTNRQFDLMREHQVPVNRLAKPRCWLAAHLMSFTDSLCKVPACYWNPAPRAGLPAAKQFKMLPGQQRPAIASSILKSPHE